MRSIEGGLIHYIFALGSYHQSRAETKAAIRRAKARLMATCGDGGFQFRAQGALVCSKGQGVQAQKGKPALEQPYFAAAFEQLRLFAELDNGGASGVNLSPLILSHPCAMHTSTNMRRLAPKTHRGVVWILGSKWNLRQGGTRSGSCERLHSARECSRNAATRHTKRPW